MRKIALSFIGLLAVVAAFFGTFAPALSAAPANPGSPQENWKELFADGLFRADGSRVKLEDAFRGKKFVGLYASASWCVPCKRFTPRLIEFYKEFGDQTEIVLIGCDSTQAEVFKYMQEHKMPWLTLNKDSAAVKNYNSRNGIRGIPNFRFYDAETGKLLVANETDLRVIRRAITKEKSHAEADTPENWKLFFRKGLFNADGKQLDPASILKEEKYVGLYCATENNPRCDKFTPELIAFYNKNKNKIEIVFFSFGKTREDLMKFAKKHKMPWLFMEPNPSEVRRFLEKYRIRSVPDFRIFNAAGRPLSHQNLDIKSADRLVR